MTVRLNPYLSFRGTAREAMTFYQSVFGGELTLTSFAESGALQVPAEEAEWVMHGQIRLDDVLTLMGADAPTVAGSAAVGEQPDPGGFSVCLNGDDEPLLRLWWEGLRLGAQIQEELSQAPWGDWFGMLVDRFGVHWMVNITTS
ncbi:VOC family protein [Nocardioides mangrovicus]|uniref:VOC family protein n=1 Tax=Nocardioides mangrovicus TaxID=2478913 RepID=A0A3L8P6L1_9ACTN|nr:VOC family protein [Nocardioides mangrovicus]RLV50734.1 VOC family protein [Nocardioides mangrovicus]